MHPAISVIFFTVTSGAGFGFMALIGLGIALPYGGLGAALACVVAVGLAVAGLLSSTLHLGHPERAWRAFTQIRSSWLSREGVSAVLTLLLFAPYSFFWVFESERISWLGLAVAFGCFVTVFTTAMIYAQLKTVPSWNTWLTPLCYLLFALTMGVLIAAAFGSWQSIVGGFVPIAAAICLVAAWGAKAIWWGRSGVITLESRGSNVGTATGLGFLGNVRLLEKPHSGENYLTKEMVHRIGRKHATKLRIISILLGIAVPLILCAIAFMAGVQPVWFAMAALSLMGGLFLERWLFFAEAKHAVSLYYQG